MREREDLHGIVLDRGHGWIWPFATVLAVIMAMWAGPAMGVTFNPNVQVTPAELDQARPSLVLDGQNVHTVWQDNRSGDWEIYYSRSSGFPGHVVYSDDFGDGDYNGWAVTAGAWDASGSVLTSTSGDTDSYIYFNVGDQVWSDYSVEFDYGGPDGSMDGDVYLRVEDTTPPGSSPQRGYRVMLRHRSYYHDLYLYRYVNGSATYLTSISLPSEYGTFHIREEIST